MQIDPARSTATPARAPSSDAGLGTRRVPTPRDSGVTTLILGFFAMAWFAWGQADASGALTVALTAGSSAAAVVAMLGAMSAYRHARGESALRDHAVSRRYGIVVGVEFASAALGAGALSALGASHYVPVWVCAVVGLHFFALAAVLGAASLRWLGAAVGAVAAIALVAGLSTSVAASSVTGSGAGLALLAYATMTLGSADLGRCRPARSRREARR